MKSFKSFIKESYQTLVKNTAVFKNPTTSEIAEIYKVSKHKEARFMSIVSIKSVFAWNADNVIHITVFNKLKDDKVISPKTDFQDYKEVFCGVAGIHSGKLLYQSSDELDYYIEKYPKPREQWPDGAIDDYENLYNNALTMMKNHSFVNKYVKGIEGDSNPFFKINQILHNLPKT